MTKTDSEFAAVIDSSSGAVTQTSEALTEPDAARLVELEAVIERGKKMFVEVGEALREVRDSRLHRATHATFEAYVKERWGMGRSQAYRLINATGVVETLSPMGDKTIPLPTSERQTRALAKVPVEDRSRILQQAVDASPQRTLTAAEIAKQQRADEICSAIAAQQGIGRIDDKPRRKIAGGTSFDPDELDAAPGPKFVNGQPVVCSVQRKKALDAIGVLVRAISQLGLYDEYWKQLDDMIKRIKRLGTDAGDDAADDAADAAEDAPAESEELFDSVEW